MAYKDSFKNQNWLLPLSIKRMIPENHICFFVEEFADNLDFSEFDLKFEGAGAPAYHPRILAKILLQGMLSKERSSRKIASACRENFVFMYLAEKLNPDFRTICRFRRENANFLKQVFKETIKLASKYNLIDLSFIAIDGTTMKANANRKRTLKKEQISKLDEIVDKLVEEDLKQDELDEKLDEENLTHMDKRDFKKIVSGYRRVKDKTKIKEKLEKVKEEVFKDEKLKKVSLTDPESRMMQNKQRVRELSYNTQLSVDKNQIIVATDVCQDGHDAHQLIPQIENVKGNVELTGEEKFSADCGYSDAENIKYCEDAKIDLFVPSRAQAQKFDGKEESLNHDKYEYDEERDELVVGGMRFKRSGDYARKDGKRIATFYNNELKKKKDVPEFFRERLRMRDKMETSKGREIYAFRKITVEPVIGQIKENLGFRQFCLRGLEGVRIEVNIVASVHNLKKIWKRLRERERVLEKNGNLSGKNFDFVIFKEIYFEIEFIMGQP
ncbi:MAG: IS1182 family transposase, partial [Candidatus Pacearchaeota archaeon]|nr:IS1182 family transposase [Candidatus Pacearchaeota archaeon]